ncbi:MAG: OmpA family protein [Nitrospirae bacterium]|nr:OmpA family protein [Nitrospirota bacterium]
MARKKKGGHDGGGGGHDATGGLRWLLTYADLITLLLALFIFLYSASQMDTAKMASFLQQWHEAFTIIGKEPIPSQTNVIPELTRYKTIREAFYERLSEELKKGEIKIESRPEALILQIFNETLFFEAASADLRPESHRVLKKISELLRGLSNQIRIVGHTDPVPIRSERYPTNWELSSARASAVGRYMIDQGVDPYRLMAAGRAEFEPIEGLLADDPRNRRVEVWILRKGQEEW